MDAGLKRELEQKVRAGERLSREDGIALYASDDLAWLGGLAHEVRTRKNGDVVHFNVNRHLNMTNVCTASCAYRSEEHTSELQSHLNLVCRLLLEKKKNTNSTSCISYQNKNENINSS